MGVIRNGLNITRENWAKSAQEIVFVLIVGLVPLLMGIILMCIFAPNSAISVLIDDGQLVMFSSALLATGFYCVGQEFKKAPFPGRAWFLLALIILVGVAVALFSGMVIAGAMGAELSYIKSVLMRNVSIALVAMSTIFVFAVIVINKAQAFAEGVEPEDILEYRAGEMERLGEEFKKLGVETLKGESEKLEGQEVKSNDK